MKHDKLRKFRDPALLGVLALGSGALLRLVFRKLGYASAGHGGEGEPDTPEALLGLASVIEASDDAIMSATLEGVVVSWNPGAERLYGYSTEEAVGRNVWEVIGPSEGASVVLSNIEEVKREETLGPFDAVHHDRNGRALNVSVILPRSRTRQARSSASPQ